VPHPMGWEATVPMGVGGRGRGRQHARHGEQALARRPADGAGAPPEVPRKAGRLSFFNLAAWDRWLRVAIGVSMLALGWSGEVLGTWALMLRVFGLFPLASGLLGWDPFYSLFGFSTRRR